MNCCAKGRTIHSGNTSLSITVAILVNRCSPRKCLLRIPVEEPNLDSSSRKVLLENFQVRAAIVIGDDDLRMEGFDGFGGFRGRHRVGEIHADESYVDIPESSHLGDTFRIRGEVELLASVGKDVSVIASLGMVELSGSGAAREVVGRNGLDAPLLPLLSLSVGDGLGGGKLLDDRGGSDYLGCWLAEGCDGFRVEMIGVNVGDQNEVCLGESRELCGLGRIDVDGFSSGLDESAGVDQGRDLHVSSRGGESLRLSKGGERSAERE